ncbi:hypothetical protein [Natronobeatus ordinarius]|uniref:hypothetical protein n=1 Tax=Natronobeatus ordinarius TaxID=2963433 RepID=UPI0020CC617B|nr:hypothetical protein [Natronobeatus ordinarius]
MDDELEARLDRIERRLERIYALLMFIALCLAVLGVVLIALAPISTLDILVLLAIGAIVIVAFTRRESVLASAR